jgi:hypothetical protein
VHFVNDRQLPKRDYLALKAAFRDLVAAAGGPNRAATKTRGNASLMSRYGAVHEEMFAPDDVIADLEAEVGEPIVTRVRADLAGFQLVPKCAADTGINFTAHLGDVAKESGEAISSLATAMADGVITPREAEGVLQEVREAGEKLACLEKDLRSVATGVVTLRRVG